MNTRKASPSPRPLNQTADTLAKLQRLYGRGGLRPNAFGRRPAMPSEIEKLAKARRASEPDPR
jgi:hypothetical protein